MNKDIEKKIDANFRYLVKDTGRQSMATLIGLAIAFLALAFTLSAIPVDSWILSFGAWFALFGAGAYLFLAYYVGTTAMKRYEEYLKKL